MISTNRQLDYHAAKRIYLNNPKQWIFFMNSWIKGLHIVIYKPNTFLSKLIRIGIPNKNKGSHPTVI